jgi:hypothetical protein
MRMKSWLAGLIGFLCFSYLLVSPGEWLTGIGGAKAESKVKIAVLDKMPKAQSAKRFEYLYPELTKRFREALANDGRFDLIPTQRVNQALRDAGVDVWMFDPDDTGLLRDIGKRAGADVVFVSYYYEMGGHAMPMHSNNVLTLVWVNRADVVKLDRDYSKVLSEEELTSGDALALKDLLKKAEEPLSSR